MPGIARKTLDSAGGQQLGGGQDFVTVDGQIAIVVDDPVTPHGLPPHNTPRMVGSSAFVSINGKKVCRQGDAASCGHVSTGANWFNINA